MLNFKFSIFIKATVVLFAFAAQSQAKTISCTGANLWKKLPAATKQQLTATANKQPYSKGRFFQVERNGRISYILGTVHLPPIKQLKLPAHVMKKVGQAKRIYVEKTPAIFQEFSAMKKRNPGYYRAGGLTNFSRNFTPSQWSAVQGALSVVGWRKGAADTLHPWFIFNQISSLNCGQDNGGLRLALDFRVMRVAAQKKVPLIGLETPVKVDAHYRALSERNLAEMIKSLPIMVDDYPFGGMGKAVIGLLGSEDIILSHVFQDYMERSSPYPKGIQLRSDFWDKKILLARNKARMPALMQGFNKGGSFVAVGAAHLSGRYGLLIMLQKKGYKITRIPLK